MRLSVLLFAGLITGSLAQAADTYKIDPVHSTVIFKAGHFGISNTYGRFTKVSGDFSVDAAKSTVNLAIDADSITTDFEMRDKHLKSPDFLDTKQFSKITFKSDSVKKISDKTYEIKGKLVLHGQTKPLTITWNEVGAGPDPKGDLRMGGEAKFTIKRSEYGMKFMLPSGNGPGVSDDIEMLVSIEGIKNK